MFVERIIQIALGIKASNDFEEHQPRFSRIFSNLDSLLPFT